MRIHLRVRQFQAAIKGTLVLVALVGALSGCTTDAAETPINSDNICIIFQQYPRWYWESVASYQKWGVPVSIQMAMMRQESSFQANAQPPRNKLLGIIPWTRPSSAYGYSQALDGTWAQYQQETKNTDAQRDSFGDAVDFMGWYGAKVNQKLSISKRDPYNLYLAYHEGMNGYANGSYKSQTCLINIAKKVQSDANTYRN